MNNSELIERFDKLNAARVDKLFFIAMMIDNRDLEGLLQDIEDESWKEIFPEIFENPHFEEYKQDNELIQLLMEYSKYGFIAEVHHPKCYNFVYDIDDKVIGFSIQPGISMSGYVYAETREELLAAIEAQSEKFHEYYIAQENKQLKASVL